MIRQILILSILWLFGAGTLAVAAEQGLGDTADETAAVDTHVVVRHDENLDGEAQADDLIEPIDGPSTREYRDARWLEIAQDAHAEISALVAEIGSLDDRGDEPALQRVIERIKLEAEISRLRVMMEDAETQEDNDRVEAIWSEIEHLSALDDSVVGSPQEQPAR